MFEEKGKQELKGKEGGKRQQEAELEVMENKRIKKKENKRDGGISVLTQEKLWLSERDETLFLYLF